jgi:hypothetical protein
MLTSLEWQTLEQRRRISRLVMMYKINSWTSTETYTPYLVTAEPEVNIGSSRKGTIMIIKSYTHVQPHCIFLFFLCRTRVVADCFKFCGTRHARHTQLMSPRLCTTKHFTMTQLKLFTLVGVANLLLEVNPELLYGAGPNCGVW